MVLEYPAIGGIGMSVFERLLVPGSTELPDCRCGQEMRVAGFVPLPERPDTHIRVYKCGSCDHELRLTIWSVETPEGAMPAPARTATPAG